MEAIMEMYDGGAEIQFVDDRLRAEQEQTKMIDALPNLYDTFYDKPPSDQAHVIARYQDAFASELACLTDLHRYEHTVTATPTPRRITTVAEAVHTILAGRHLERRVVQFFARQVLEQNAQTGVGAIDYLLERPELGVTQTTRASRQCLTFAERAT